MNLTGSSFARFSVCVAILLVVLASVACNSHEKHVSDSPARHYEQLMAEVEGLRDNRNVIHVIDSLYNALHNPTIEDLCDKYLLKSFYSKYDNVKEELFADSALRVIRNTGLENEIPVLYGKAYLFKGEALMHRKNFNGAYNCYYVGIKIMQGTHDTVEFDQFHAALGNICYLQGDYLHSANYFKECFNDEYRYTQYRHDFLKSRYLQANMDNIGLCYDNLGMPDSAIYYYNKALDYAAQYEKKFIDHKDSKELIEIAKGIIFGNLGTAYFHKGDIKNAEKLYKMSIGINTQKGNEIGDAELTEAKLAELYLKTSRLKEAKETLDKLNTSFDSIYLLKDAQMRWYKLESDYYNLMQQPKEAHAYLDTFMTQKDSIDAANKKLAGMDFNKVFEDIKQEESLVALKNQNEVNNVNSLVAIVFLCIMIGVAVFASRNNSRLKKLNEKIILQNVEMQQALGALEQSQRENTRMMEMITYDLRDPLDAIVNMTNFLLEGEQPMESPKEFLKLIQISSSALLGRATDLLSASISPENMKKEVVDMKALIGYCVDLLKFKANEKKQSISLRVDNITLVIDREKIWRVMSYFLTNAIKFSPESSTIEIEMHRKEAAIQISIKGNCDEVPDSIKKDIADVFSNTRSVGVAGESYFAWGLSISKQIVEALGGEIWFGITEGKGTTFFIEFPNNKIITA